MNQEIAEYVKEFQLNTPTFTISIVPMDTNSLKIIPLNKAQEPDPGTDPIKNMVHTLIEQRFDTETLRFKIDTSQLEDRVNENIRTVMMRFLETNLDATKPRQTKLWRWLRGNSSPPVVEGLLLLYKYVYPHCSKNQMRWVGNDTVHLKNAILILEAMHKRYP